MAETGSPGGGVGMTKTGSPGGGVGMTKTGSPGGGVDITKTGSTGGILGIVRPGSTAMSLAVFSLTHLVVDFACFFVLFGVFYVGVEELPLISAGFLLYNAVAFALQVPIGFLADKVRFSHGFFAVVGLVVVLLGVLIPASPWLRLAFCALGNACFHIGGGIDSLVFARGRFARSGIFISFGALGVALGTLSGKGELLTPAWVAVILAICTLLVLRFCLLKKQPYEAPFSFPPARIKASELVVYLCLIAIVVRAVVGAYTPVPWKSTVFLTLLPAIVVFAGKFSGGMLADRFGARRVASMSLLISAPLLAFANDQIILCCIGLFLFNITTAVTLCVLVDKLPQNPGLGFGLTTLALFVGTGFSFFFAMPESWRPLLTCALIIVAIGCIMFTTPKRLRIGN